MATITSPRPQSPAPLARVQSPQIPTSPSLTPSSSVRPSFDLPTNVQSSSPAPPAVNQKRNRAALRDYYNLKNKSAHPQASGRTLSIASNASNETSTSTLVADSDLGENGLSQLDEPGFDAEAYVQELLKTSNLRTVLKTEAALVSEIKNLDGEQKALVYDNYSKLISATQTIGSMRKTMDEAEGGNLQTLNTLQPVIDDIAKTAGEMNEAPSADAQRARDVTKKRKSKMRELKEKREVVKWALQAPERLQGLKEDGQNNAMETEWQEIQDLLSGWNGVRGVDDLRRSCEEIMATKAIDDEG